MISGFCTHVFQHTFAFLGDLLAMSFICVQWLHALVSQAACITFLDWSTDVSIFSCYPWQIIVDPCLLLLSFAIRFCPLCLPLVFHSFYVYLVFRANDDNGSRSGGVSNDTLVFGFQWRLINFGSAWLVSGWARFGFSLTKPGRFVCIGRSWDPAMHCACYEF